MKDKILKLIKKYGLSDHLKKQTPRRVDAQPATGGGSTYVPPVEPEDTLDAEAEEAAIGQQEVSTKDIQNAAQNLVSRPSISGAWSDEADWVTLKIIQIRNDSGTDRRNGLEEIMTYLRHKGLRSRTQQEE